MEANAYPAKRFFVEMLTRDIDLEAAILDLLDNCVDGCLRAGPIEPAIEGKPYAGYFASITISPDGFKIEDNCGGIEPKLAEDYAFRFGRKDTDRDRNIATVGVYGIGMKRAIFKLGTHCLINSSHPSGGFSVEINKDWMDSDDEWSLPMVEKTPSQTYGTSIHVTALHAGISNIFNITNGSYIENFSKKLQKNYTYIIEKGFKVIVNDLEIKSKTITTIMDANAFNDEQGITPYVYFSDYEGVKINLVFGLYEKLPTLEDEEASITGSRSKEEAGWTIICNDRVILENDKSHLTGWGEAGVPQYHSQFIALGGYVSFTSSDASKLPVTTTKRNIDLESPLYASVKEEMRQALKTFTSFTNSWKSLSKERTEMQAKTTTHDIREAVKKVPASKWTTVRKGLQGQRYKPTLPKTPNKRTHARIQFEKSMEEIYTVRDFLLDDANAIPSDVGIAAFDWALVEARKK